MFVEQLIKKEEDCMISGFLEEGGVFLFLAGCPPSLLSFFLYPRKPVGGRIQLSFLKNHISLIWHLFWMTFEALIGLWVRNPKKLSLHQLDFFSSRYSSWNGRRSTLADCEIGLWRLRFPCSSLFYFLALDVQKGMDVSFLMPLESLHFNL